MKEKKNFSKPKKDIFDFVVVIGRLCLSDN